MQDTRNWILKIIAPKQKLNRKQLLGAIRKSAEYQERLLQRDGIGERLSFRKYEELVRVYFDLLDGVIEPRTAARKWREICPSSRPLEVICKD